MNRQRNYLAGFPHLIATYWNPSKPGKNPPQLCELYIVRSSIVAELVVVARPVSHWRHLFGSRHSIPTPFKKVLLDLGTCSLGYLFASSGMKEANTWSEKPANLRETSLKDNLSKCHPNKFKASSHHVGTDAAKTSRGSPPKDK